MSSQNAIFCPFMEMILSPFTNPASKAADSFCTSPISDVRLGKPYVRTIININTASKKLKTGPDKTINILFQTDCLQKDLFSSSGDNSSLPDSPRSLTNPPKGIQESTYSVSPIFRPKIFGPKPRENFKTPTPEILAARKWPNSWTKIRIPSKTIKEIKVITISSFLLFFQFPSWPINRPVKYHPAMDY